ncbi:MAG TPA: ATP-binding protein [Chloroflexota bacterium]
MRFDRANDPNAARLIESLRYLGYGNYEAIADLVDNSIDADATHIGIRIQQRDGQFQIIVADDGSGMDFTTLDEAMRLGSLTARDLNSDLGKFGMGLVTASQSIAKRCHVITRTVDGCWSSAWDVEEVKARNAFVKHLAQATEDEAEMLDGFVGSGHTGTAVILTECDNITNKNTTSFASTLKHHLGRVDRYFIEAGREMLVNSERVGPRDPLQLADSGTEVVLDDIIPVSVTEDGFKRVENVRARLALVPEPTASDLDIGLALKNQGFYVMRNQREVMNAMTLEFFTKHNDFNRMRGEVFFSGTLDRLVGIEFTKRQVNFDKSLYDQLANILVPVCRSIKRGAVQRRRAKTSDAQKQLHMQAAKAIAEKDKLLLKPKARIEKRASPGGRDGASTPEPREPERQRKNFGRVQAVQAALNCEIREEHLGPNGQIYECDLEGRKVIIRYNVEHPFYERFLIDILDDGRLATATDFLIYSMASAELRMLDDGGYEAVNNFKAVMSANLRTLLH